jgi:hypothetical protein
MHFKLKVLNKNLLNILLMSDKEEQKHMFILDW